MNEPDGTNKPNFSGAWKVTGGIVILILFASLFGGRGSGGRSSNPARAASTSTDYSSSERSTPKADAFTSGSGAYMDDREKQLYESDPSSMGYTDADRDFLKEHGVSEDEARAAETILHREGID